MFFLVSGEGSSDIGTHSANATKKAMYEGDEFVAGPMAIIIEKMANFIKSDYSFSVKNDFAFLHKNELKQKRAYHSPILPGRKRKIETALFFHNAYTLGQIAKELEKRKRCPVIAVLFRDTDGTHSTRNGMLEEKRKSMEDGFSYSGCQNGISMIPKPKSEVWLLCALQENPYNDCQRFENLSGNDAAPDSAKNRLEQRFQSKHINYSDVPKMIQDGSIDPNRVDMPSLNYFRDRLAKVLNSV